LIKVLPNHEDQTHFPAPVFPSGLTFSA
jgi:hypothetical protein